MATMSNSAATVPASPMKTVLMSNTSGETAG